jgi:CubicO group peptidase (beta-lactamase class C family)
VALATQATVANPLGAERTALRAADDAQRCIAARTLLSRWGPLSSTRVRLERDAAWRFWNADDADATRVVAAHFSALVRVQHATCTSPQRDPH